MRTILVAALGVALWSVVSAQTPQTASPGAPQPQDVAAGRGRGGRGPQPGLEPRIVSFEARPATVRAGEPVLLVWATEDEDVVRTFVDSDPYVRNGLVASWSIRKWNVVVGG